MSTAGQVITCTAAVAYGSKEPLKIEEIQVEPPHASEVRVKITHTSLCHSDLTMWGEDSPLRFPCILGHEAAGIVESVGDLVKDIFPGDHVLTLFLGECKECKTCKYEKTNYCEKFNLRRFQGMISDDGTRFSKDGKPIFHFLGTSTFSEYTVLDHGQVVKVNPAAPLEKICLLSCGVTTGLGAAWKSAKVEAGSAVAVFGLGTIGLAVAEGARVAGASRIIGVDLNNEKYELAKIFGVTDFLNPSEHEKPVSEVIKEMTGGGVDYSFECVGNVKLAETAVESCHVGYGVCVLCGVVIDPTKVMLNHPSTLIQGRTIKGTYYGNFKGVTELPNLVERYLRKEFQLDEFVTQELPFSEINQAFQLMIQGKGLRCVLHTKSQ